MHRRQFLVQTVGLCTVAEKALRAENGQDNQWGDLKMRFVYDGFPPPVKKLAVTVDCDYCGKFEQRDERLVVHPENKGIANVFVWLYKGHAKVPIHPDYDETAKAEVSLNSTHCRIDPHASTLRTTQTLHVQNTDPIADGIRINPLLNRSVNIMFAPGGETRLRFPMPELLPAHVSCPVHPWESGWLLIQDHPYMGTSNADGELTIAKLPVGRWTFRVWHEASGYVTAATSKQRPLAWLRGRVNIDIRPGLNDLGDLHLSPSLFKRATRAT